MSRSLLTTLHLQGGNGNWAAANWTDGSNANLTWTPGDQAVLDSADAATITISSSISAASVTSDFSGYTITGGTLTLTGTGSDLTGLWFDDTTLNVSGSASSTYNMFVNGSQVNNDGTLTLSATRRTDLDRCHLSIRNIPRVELRGWHYSPS